jgi:hypothetical protein
MIFAIGMILHYCVQYWVPYCVLRVLYIPWYEVVAQGVLALNLVCSRYT